MYTIQEIAGGDIFADVGLFPWFCGFVWAAPAQQHTICGGQSDPQSSSWKRAHQRKTRQQSKPKDIKRANINCIKSIPRASSSGDQGDCTTESHRSPTIEVHTTKSESQNRSI